MHDSGWHHVCARWNSEDGKWCIYVNGDQYCETNYNTGQTIQGSGKFILGQEQDSYGITPYCYFFSHIIVILYLSSPDEDQLYSDQH